VDNDPRPAGAAAPLCLSKLQSSLGARVRTPWAGLCPSPRLRRLPPNPAALVYQQSNGPLFWFSLEFDKQSGSVRGWETDEPRSGCAQALSLCAGLFSTPASVGDPSPDAR